jgi:low affinity Fe/Cu permease
MSGKVENLMLEHLKRFQATLERIESKISELTMRQNETHSAVIGLRRDQAQDAEVAAHLQVQPDAVRDRLDRIERRIEITN